MKPRLLFAILLCSVTVSVLAANSLATIRARGQLIVSVKNVGDKAVEKHRDPAHFQKRGMELAIARAIAKHILGSPEALSLKMMRKPERLPAIARGEVDLGISMLRVTPGNAKLVDFSTPYYRNGLALLEAQDGAIHGKRDLAGKTVAVIERNDGDAAAMLAAIADATGSTPKVLPVANFKDGVAAIKDGRVAGLLSEAVNIDVFLAKHGGPFKRSPLLTEDSFAVAVPKGNSDLLAAVNEVLAALEASGELKAMATDADLPKPE
ncbi:MAG: transporter substrate-binding domain-containing protein [Gammaproteobacteria bacterium]|nr:transporter substrate-binding domain-containing protein [Gammaproteobacteria bacterium]